MPPRCRCPCTRICHPRVSLDSAHGVFTCPVHLLLCAMRKTTRVPSSNLCRSRRPCRVSHVEHALPCPPCALLPYCRTVRVLPYHEAIRDNLRQENMAAFLAPVGKAAQQQQQQQEGAEGSEGQQQGGGEVPLVLVATDRTSRGASSRAHLLQLSKTPTAVPRCCQADSFQRQKHSRAGRR